MAYNKPTAFSDTSGAGQRQEQVNVFGEDYRASQDETVRTTQDSSNPPTVVVHSFETVVPAPGMYRMGIQFRWGLDSTSQNFIAQVCDSTNTHCSGVLEEEPKDPTSRAIVSIFRHQHLDPGTWVWELRIASEGAATALVDNSSFEFWRVE